jgi:hypothetical protein
MEADGGANIGERIVTGIALSDDNAFDAERVGDIPVGALFDEFRASIWSGGSLGV